MNTTTRNLVKAKTGGHCHVCGGLLDDTWQVDHVIPRHQGGVAEENNYLPICRTCNRLRWSHKPKTIRRIIRLGVYAWPEYKAAKRNNKPTKLGRKLHKLFWSRWRGSKSRREAAQA